MDPQQIRFIMGCIALIGVLLFVLAWGTALYRTWKWVPTTDKPKYEPNKPLTYVATAMAGLVGGVVAMQFGVKLPTPPLGAAQPGLAIEKQAERGPRFIESVVKAVTPAGPENVLSSIATVYVWSYIAIGFAAIATWMFVNEKTPSLIEHMALTWLGLLVLIATNFFQVPKP